VDLTSSTELTTAAAMLLSVLAAGCLPDRIQTNTVRTSTEQLLLTEAVERAVAALELPDVSGRRVALEIVALGPGQEFYVDVPYVRAALDSRLLHAGATVVAETPDLQMTARVGTLGTTAREFTLGIRDVGLYRSSKQHGYTKLTVVTRDRAGHFVAESRPVMKHTRHDYIELMQIILRNQDIYPDDRTFDVD